MIEDIEGAEVIMDDFPFCLSPNKGHLLCSINYEHPKNRLKYLLKVILLSYKICTTH